MPLHSGVSGGAGGLPAGAGGETRTDEIALFQFRHLATNFRDRANQLVAGY